MYKHSIFARVHHHPVQYQSTYRKEVIPVEIDITIGRVWYIIAKYFDSQYHICIIIIQSTQHMNSIISEPEIAIR
jgi:hypothetical protein